MVSPWLSAGVTASALLGICAACGGGTQGPYFGDERFLRFGVDPRVEADAVASQLKRAGMRVIDRAEGPHHVALGVQSESRDRSAVRVVTGRGTALSLDSSATITAPRDYQLVVTTQLQNVEALPSDEVFVRVTDRESAITCLAAFRVNAEGQLARVVIDAGAVIVGGCASEIDDSNRDGSIELVVQAAYASFSEDDPPLVRVPLSAHGGGYRFVAGVGPVIAMLGEQRAQAQADLNAARHALNVERAFRSAVELAAIARFEGASMGAQLKTFDDALRGMVLSGRQAALIENARHLIRQGWSEPEAEPAPDVADPVDVAEQAAPEAPTAPAAEPVTDAGAESSMTPEPALVPSSPSSAPANPDAAVAP